MWWPGRERASSFANATACILQRKLLSCPSVDCCTDERSESVYAASLLYALAVTSAKLSILLYYGRIFTLGRFRQALYAVGSICTLWCVLVVFVTLFQCSPVRKGWEPGLEGSCLNLRTIYYGTAISNMILDVIINVLPVKMVWKLQLPLRQRMLLMVIMGLGVM